MYQFEPLQPKDTRNVGLYAVTKRSPYSNYKQHLLKNQNLKGKLSTMRPNGKRLEYIDAVPNFGNGSPNFEMYHNENLKLFEANAPDNTRYKTEICRNFKERSNCIYGDQCQFAHGRQELRDASRNNKYKTKSCQKYWVTGYCAYGPRCNFLHLESEDSYNLKSPLGVGVNRLIPDSYQEALASNGKHEVSPVSSDEELVETVQEVISTGRKILNEMENKSISDPKLEDLFEKLKRALPTKRSSTPVMDLSKMSASNCFDVSRTSPIELQKGDGGYANYLALSKLANQNDLSKADQRFLETEVFGNCTDKFIANVQHFHNASQNQIYSTYF
jgi:hypothetical protein